MSVVDPILFNKLVGPLSVYLHDNINTMDALIDTLHNNGVISDQTGEELQNMTSRNEKVECLIKSIETAVAASPETLQMVLEQMQTIDGLKELIDNILILSDQGEPRPYWQLRLFNITFVSVFVEIQQMLEAIYQDMMSKYEHLDTKRQNAKANIERKLKEINKQMFGDESIELTPITTPRYPRGPNSTLEDKKAWIVSEFEELSRIRAERREERMRLIKKIDQDCDEMMEDMKRRKETRNRRMAMARK